MNIKQKLKRSLADVIPENSGGVNRRGVYVSQRHNRNMVQQPMGRHAEVTFTSGKTQPVKLVNPGSTVTTSSTCDVSTPYSTGTNHMLIASGQETAAATQCPDPLLATFNSYTIDIGSGAQCGGSAAFINICTDLASISIDYTLCSTKAMYSNAGNLQCVYYSSSGSTYYVNVYNKDTTVDDTSYFRYACLVLPSSSSEGSDFPIVIVIVVFLLLLLIILVALAVYHLWYRKRWSVVRDMLPCKGRGQQVNPNVAVQDATVSRAPNADSLGVGMETGWTPTTVTTAIVSNDSEKRLMSSQSTRSVATPSKLQPELSSLPEDDNETIEKKD
nr:hypothetical protein BaRGS_026116 [Batillaria attramentaria]